MILRRSKISSTFRRSSASRSPLEGSAERSRSRGADSGKIRRAIQARYLGGGGHPTCHPEHSPLAVLKDPDKFGRHLHNEAKATIAKIGVKSIRDAATDGLEVAESGLTRAAREADAIGAELERVFDEVMDRASGSYKRYVQWWLLALATATAIGLNVDAFTVAQRLWKNDALRAAVVQQAQKTVADTEKEDAKTPSAAPAETASPAQVAEQIDDIKELEAAGGLGSSQHERGLLGAPRWLDRHGCSRRPWGPVLVRRAGQTLAYPRYRQQGGDDQDIAAENRQGSARVCDARRPRQVRVVIACRRQWTAGLRAFRKRRRSQSGSGFAGRPSRER